jgi:hypothetical protein
MVTTFYKTRRKQEPSPLFKIGRKRDKLEKPERKETNDQKHHIQPGSRSWEENMKTGSKSLLVPGFSTKIPPGCLINTLHMTAWCELGISQV